MMVMWRSPRLFDAVVRRLAGADRKWRPLSSIATYEGTGEWPEGRGSVICVSVLAEGVDGDGFRTGSRALRWYALNPPPPPTPRSGIQPEEENYNKMPRKLPSLFCEFPEFFSDFTCSVSLNSEILVYQGEHSKLIDLSRPQITVRSLKEAPLVLQKPSAAVVDGKIYVWGRDVGGLDPTLLKAFDPANNVWDECVPLPSKSNLPFPGFLLSMARPLVYEKKKIIFLYQNLKLSTLVSFDLTTQSWQHHSYCPPSVTSSTYTGSPVIVDDILFTCYGKQVLAYYLDGPGPLLPVRGLGGATDLINEGDKCFLFHMGNLQLCLMSFASLPHRIGISITRIIFTVSVMEAISGPPVFYAFLSGTDFHFIPDATRIQDCLLVHQATSLAQAPICPLIIPPDLEAEGTPESHARRRCSWSGKNTESFVRVMLNIVAAQGKGVVSHNMKDAFVLAAEELKKLGINTTSASVYYKYKQMREEYHMAVETLGQSGFSFNHAKGCIEADPSVWEKWIEEKPKASCLRAKRLPYLEECSAIFKTGCAARGSGRKSNDANLESQVFSCMLAS